MAETAIATVLSKLGGLAASEARVLLEVGDDMVLLRDRLEWLQAFLRDADHKRRAGADRLTCVWVRQTRDVAFEAEDALDEFFRKVDLESMGYQRWIKWLKEYLLGCWTQIILRYELSGRLKKINSRLNQISDNQKEYKIEHTPSAALTSSTSATSAWYGTYVNPSVAALLEIGVGPGINSACLGRVLLEPVAELHLASVCVCKVPAGPAAPLRPCPGARLSTPSATPNNSAAMGKGAKTCSNNLMLHCEAPY